MNAACVHIFVKYFCDIKTELILHLHAFVMARTLCVICLTPSNCKRCLCGGGWYCGHDCQLFDWKFADDPHRQVCSANLAKQLFRQRLGVDLQRYILSFYHSLSWERDSREGLGPSLHPQWAGSIKAMEFLLAIGCAHFCFDCCWPLGSHTLCAISVTQLGVT